MADVAERFYATGHRKNAIAKVWLKPGTGQITVNNRPLADYVGRRTLVQIVRQPLELANAARARGLRLMTGCMVSSSLSIAAALHVARLSDYADLDGPLWLREDRPGGVRDEGGWLLPPQRGFWGAI